MSLSGLNEDVLVEMFLHFVAIDWDGPFTLTLICQEWRDLVVSTPRLWTWIMVDNSQTDWKERVQVAVALSRNLPLQVILRLPFDTVDTLLDNLPQCKTVFLLTGESSRGFTTLKGFKYEKNYYVEVYQLMLPYLKSLSIRSIAAVIEPGYGICFAYTTWTIYGRLFHERVSFDEILTMPLPLVTSLVLTRDGFGGPYRIPITNIWSHLPSLTSLSYLDLSDEGIVTSHPKDIPIIRLASLLTLGIESIGGGLLGIVGRLTAPGLHTTILRGSSREIIDAIGDNESTLYPARLSLRFSTDSKGTPPVLIQKPLWLSLDQITISFDSIARKSLSPRMVKAVHSILLQLPKDCVVNLHGAQEIENILQLTMHPINGFNIYYRSTNTFRRENKWSDSPRRIKTLILGGESPRFSQVCVPWIRVAEEIFVQENICDILFNPLITHSTGSAVSSSIRATLLDTGRADMYPHNLPNSGLICGFGFRERFINLTILRCTPTVAATICHYFDTPYLHTLTLFQGKGGIVDGFEPLIERLFTRCENFPRLTVLGVEGTPYWPHFLYLAANFNKQRGGISSVNLPGLPNPIILKWVVHALQKSSGTALLLFMSGCFPDYYPSVYPGCLECFRNGWTCHSRDNCRRFNQSSTVTITKDTCIGDYSAD